MGSWQQFIDPIAAYFNAATMPENFDATSITVFFVSMTFGALVIRSKPWVSRYAIARIFSFLVLVSFFLGNGLLALVVLNDGRELSNLTMPILGMIGTAGIIEDILGIKSASAPP